jgi:2-phosphosulfolactate phosphatase
LDAVLWHHRRTSPVLRPPASNTALDGLGAHFEWGESGAAALAEACELIVVVDVLSFTTTVSVAAGRGTEVLPCRDADEGQRLAATTGGVLAVGRHEQDTEHPWSLSPVSVRDGPPVDRLVLPSPNGSAIASIVSRAGKPVIAACLRNAGAVAAWLGEHGYGTPGTPVAVIAAGERWSDGSLRPAIEDLFGAALVISALAAGGTALSAEATVAERSVIGLAPKQIADLVRASRSGVELRVAGYEGDVEIAVEVDADDAVPILRDNGAGFRS